MAATKLHLEIVQSMSGKFFGQCFCQARPTRNERMVICFFMIMVDIGTYLGTIVI